MIYELIYVIQAVILFYIFMEMVKHLENTAVFSTYQAHISKIINCFLDTLSEKFFFVCLTTCSTKSPNKLLIRIK